MDNDVESTVEVSQGESRCCKEKHDDGRLEGSSEGFCKDCGVELPFCAWYFEDFERCPDCFLEVAEKRVFRVFGSTETADVIRGHKRSMEAYAEGHDNAE